MQQRVIKQTSMKNTLDLFFDFVQELHKNKYGEIFTFTLKDYDSDGKDYWSKV